jgi:hypothetical protein
MGIILKWTFRKWDGVWTEFTGLRIGTGSGLSCKSGNELSDSITCGEFLD